MQYGLLWGADWKREGHYEEQMTGKAENIAWEKMWSACAVKYWPEVRSSWRTNRQTGLRARRPKGEMSITTPVESVGVVRFSERYKIWRNTFQEVYQNRWNRSPRGKWLKRLLWRKPSSLSDMFLHHAFLQIVISSGETLFYIYRRLK